MPLPLPLPTKTRHVDPTQAGTYSDGTFPRDMIHLLIGSRPREQEQGVQASISPDDGDRRWIGPCSDLQLVAGDGVSFDVHSWLLVGRSPHFRTMLGSGLQESRKHRIAVPSVTGVTLGLFLEFLYCDSIRPDLGPERAVDLLEAAQALREPRLARLCEGVLVRCLDADNCMWLLGFADAHACQDLREACVSVILRSWSAVSRSDDFESADEALKAELRTRFVSVRHAYALEAGGTLLDETEDGAVGSEAEETGDDGIDDDGELPRVSRVD